MQTTKSPKAGERTQKNFYKGYRMYFCKSGSNLWQRSIKAKHPMSVARLEIVFPDSGMSKPAAINLMKREIDRVTVTE